MKVEVTDAHIELKDGKGFLQVAYLHSEGTLYPERCTIYASDVTKFNAPGMYKINIPKSVTIYQGRFSFRPVLEAIK